MARYSQYSAPFHEALTALASNDTRGAASNPLVAPVAFIGSWISAFAISAVVCCPSIQILRFAFQINEDESLVLFFGLCSIIYLVWCAFKQHKRDIVYDADMAVVAFECMARLTPYANTDEASAIFSLPGLCDITVPIAREGRIDLQLSREGGHVVAELGVGPWDPLDAGSWGTRQRTKAKRSHRWHSRRRPEIGPQDAAVVLGDFVSAELLKQRLPMIDPPQSGRSAGAVRLIRRRGLSSKAVDGPKEAPLKSRIPLTITAKALGDKRRRWTHLGVYWAVTLWPFVPLVALWVLMALSPSPGPSWETILYMFFFVTTWLSGFFAWHPPLRQGQRPSSARVQGLVWKSGRLTEVASQQAIDMERPFSLHLTREPSNEGQITSLGVELSQSGAAGDMNRLRFCVPAHLDEALLSLPEMATQAPEVSAEDFESWLWPLIAQSTSIHGGVVSWSLASQEVEASGDEVSVGQSMASQTVR